MKFIIVIALILGGVYFGKDFLNNTAPSSELTNENIELVMNMTPCQNDFSYANEIDNFINKYYDPSYVIIDNATYTGAIKNTEKTTKTRYDILTKLGKIKDYKLKCLENVVDITSININNEATFAKVSYIVKNVATAEGQSGSMKFASTSTCKLVVKKGSKHPLLIKEMCDSTTHVTKN